MQLTKTTFQKYNKKSVISRPAPHVFKYQILLPCDLSAHVFCYVSQSHADTCLHHVMIIQGEDDGALMLRMFMSGMRLPLLALDWVANAEYECIHTQAAQHSLSLSSVSFFSTINPSSHIITNDPCKVIEMSVMRPDPQRCLMSTHTFLSPQEWGPKLYTTTIKVYLSCNQ